MFFQAKRTFEKHLKAEAEVLPNTPEPNTKTLKWWIHKMQLIQTCTLIKLSDWDVVDAYSII